MNILKKICLWSISILGVLLMSIFILASVYEEDVKAYALEELGKHLKTEIKVSAINLTLWDHFPQASLQFKDVYIEETFEAKDTLLFAESVSLNFNISNLISGNYTIDEVALNNASLNLKRSKSGEDNYHFWKASDSESGNFTLELEQVILTESDILFNDLASSTFLDISANTLEVNGTVSDKNMVFSGDLDTKVHSLKVADQEYLKQKNISGTSEVHIDLIESIYSFKNTELEVNSLPISISGTIDIEEKNSIVDLNAVTQSASLAQAVQNLPDFIQTNLVQFHPSGNFSTTVSIRGPAGGGVVPDISGVYAISDGKIENRESKISIKEISAKGTYSAPYNKEDLLTLSEFSGSFSGEHIELSGKASRLKSPFINAEANGNIDLNSFSEFFNIPEIESMDGSTQVELKYRGNLGPNWIPSAQNIRSADLSGRVSIQESAIKLKKNEHKIENISGELMFSKGDAAVNQLQAQIGKSDFNFNGNFRNVLGYVLVPNEQLRIESTLNSDLIDLNTLLTSSGAENGEEYNLNLPSNIDFSLDASVNKLNFREFEAEEILTKAVLKNKSLNLETIKLKTAKGEIKSNLTARQQENGNFFLKSNGQITRVDVSELFREFENFSQNFVTHDHLQGTATSAYTFSGYMSNKLDLLTETVDALADVTLEQGELKNHATLEEIGVYMEEKKLLGAFMNVGLFKDKLKHVKFSQLTNQIRIKDNMVSIPKMTIESDALNIKAEGSHSFANKIDYSIGFDVADLTRREGLEEDEKGLSKNVFISMKGSVENPIFNYDRLAVKQERKDNRKEEVHKIRSLVRNEFSKKDDEKASERKDDDDETKKLKIEWKEEKAKEEKPTIITEDNDSSEDEDDDF